MSENIVIDPDAFQQALDALTAVKVPGLADAAASVAAAAALPLEEGANASPALAAMTAGLASLRSEGAATAAALAAATAALDQWRDTTVAIQHHGASGVKAAG